MLTVLSKQTRQKTTATTIAVALLCSPLTLVLASGCRDTFSSRAKREAKQAVEPDYDQQVAELRKVVAENPGDTDNQIRLAEAESKAADQHVAKAVQLRNERKLRDAQEELKTALDQVPAHPKALTMRAAIEKQLQRAEDLTKQAQTALDNQDFKTANRLATEAAELDPRFTTAGEIRERASRAAVKDNLDAAVKALEARQWDTALAAAAKVREFDPANTAATSIEKQVESRSAAMRMLETARTAMQRKDYPAAVTLFQKAANLWPENAELVGERDQVVRATIEYALAQADAEAAKEQYLTAINALDAMLVVLPDREELAKRKADISRRWSRNVQEHYEKHALSGEWELAWVAAVKAAAVALPNTPRNVQNLDRAEEMIRQSISYRLSIVSMKTPMVPPEVASAICLAIAEDLGKSKPDLVRLVDSARANSVIEESDLAPATASQPASRPAANVLANQLPDVDLALLIDVVANRADNKQPGQPGTSKFLAGRKNIQNTAYATAEATLREARKALGQSRSDALLNEKTWDLAGRRALANEQTFAERAVTGYYGNRAKNAADQYVAAVKALDQTPQWTQVDDWQEHQYPVHQITRDVDVRIRMRLVEVATARIIWQDDQTTSRASHTDSQIEGDVVHNVAAKAANLKDSRELIAEAVNKVLPTLRAKGRAVLAHRAEQYMEQARRASGEERTVGYVRFLFDSGSRCDEKDAAMVFGEIFGAREPEGGTEACKRLAMDRLNMQFRITNEPQTPLLAGAPAATPSAALPAGVTSGQPASRPALPDGVIVSSGRQPRETPVAQSRPANQLPTVAQWPGQARRPPTPIARADQRRDRQESSPAKSAREQQKTSATSNSTQMKPAPAVPVPLPPPTDRAADIASGRVYQGIVSRDDKRYKKEIVTVDGITIKLKDTGGSPLDADVEVRVGRTSTRKNDLPIGTRMLIRGASGRRYDLAITAIDHKTETLWFTMQQTTLESLPR